MPCFNLKIAGEAKPGVALFLLCKIVRASACAEGFAMRLSFAVACVWNLNLAQIKASAKFQLFIWPRTPGEFFGLKKSQAKTLACDFCASFLCLIYKNSLFNNLFALSQSSSETMAITPTIAFHFISINTVCFCCNSFFHFFYFSLLC